MSNSQGNSHSQGNRHGRYVLASELLSPMGMNLDLSLALANADLSRFAQRMADNGIDKYTFAQIEYLAPSEFTARVQAMVASLLDSLLKQLPRSLKPLPLMINLPRSVSGVEMQEWLDESTYSAAISQLEVMHVSGPKYIEKNLRLLDKHDALICLNIDSLVVNIETLIAKNNVLGSSNPWGIIPSEGAAGFIFVRKNIVDTLKLKPIARLGQFSAEYEVSDRRAMLRLVKTLNTEQSFGTLYSDMTNTRKDTEEYGFALGARAQQFVNPQQPVLINELWGTLGESSASALLATTIALHRGDGLATLMMFSVSGDRAILQLETRF